MVVNSELKRYIENEIFPYYKNNDIGHNLEHIKYVIDRSLKFASLVSDISIDMVYTIAAFHDIGVYIDRDNHEKLSAEIFLKDENMKEFFTDEERKIIAEAIEDHRASKDDEPRSIYGKIVSSADRNVSIELPLIRTFTFRMKLNPGVPMEEILEESRKHLIKKFGHNGYANEKMFFEDLEYKSFLENIADLVADKESFKKKYIEINHLEGIFDSNDIDKRLNKVFMLIKENNPEFSLDQLLYATYSEGRYSESFEQMKDRILSSCGIDEFEYYLTLVNPELIEYVENNIFPQYDNNDQAHGIIHISEVIRRSFALNETLKLNLDKNMIYAIAACHDLGKFIDHNIHEKIAADMFINDLNMKKFFSDEERVIIKEAIEDHRSSKEDEPRSDYGRLISSADRNTRIEIVFIRSFFVAKERMPESSIVDYLDYTYKRLSKRYGEENPENMFYEDEIYQVFLKDMRNLLKDEQAFKELYCEINHITDRSKIVNDYDGEIHYTKKLQEVNKMVNSELKKYIEENIFPMYEKYYSHGMIHINNVINNVMMLAECYDLNKDMCYVMAAYHDVGLRVDRDNHEKESGKFFINDEMLKNFFSEEELIIIKEAIEDHRGSRKVEPRNIYGKVLSDSDRDFDIELLAKRQLATSLKNCPNLKTGLEHFENCYSYIMKRLNGEGHFNLWTNNQVLIDKREKFEKDFLDKEYAKEVYLKEYARIEQDGTIEKIINYYEDY